MCDINQKYNIRLTVLTPTFVGCGAENDLIEGVDFVVKTDGDGKHWVHILSFDKLCSMLNRSGMAQYTNCLLSRSSQQALRIIGNRLEKVTYQKYKTQLSRVDVIKRMITNQLTDKPILPGSSIKGVFMGIIKTLLGCEGPQSVNSILGTAKNGDAFSRFVKFRDMEFAETDLINTKIFNLWRDGNSWVGGWKHGANQTNGEFRLSGFNTVYQCLPVGSVCEGEMMLSPQMFEKYNNEYGTQMSKVPQKRELLDIRRLFAKINDHTYSHLNKEYDFFEKYNATRTVTILDGLGYLINSLPPEGDNSDFCVFQLAAGSGFHSITGDWQFDDYAAQPLGRKANKDRIRNGELVNPKSRRIALTQNNRFDFMGYVKIQLI